MRRRMLLLLTLPLLVMACRPVATERREGPVASSQTGSTAARVTPTTNAPVAAAPAPASTEARPMHEAVKPSALLKLAVDGEGLRLVDAQSGTTRPLHFGLPRAVVLEPLEKLRGAADQGTDPECGGEYANWADGLSLNFRRGKFVGWSLDDRSDGAITTLAGLGTGSGKVTLDAYDYKLVRTTLGNEFRAGALNGLLSSAAANAKVTNLWAGEVCLAR